MSKKKKDYEFLLYFLGMIFVLILHYFFISKININSTIQVAIDFVILTLLTGFISILVENFQKKK